jgi:hypothetical protein
MTRRHGWDAMNDPAGTWHTIQEHTATLRRMRTDDPGPGLGAERLRIELRLAFLSGLLAALLLWQAFATRREADR